MADLPAGATRASCPGGPRGPRAVVRRSEPFLGFRLERAFGRSDLSTPEGRAKAAEAALSAVAEHPDELVSDQYVMQVADRLPARAGVVAGPARATPS